MFVFLQSLPVCAESAEAAQARVEASHAAMRAAESDYRQQRARGTLSSGEAADYRAYLAQLRDQFFRACADLAVHPERRFAFNSPCPPSLPRVSRPAAIDQASEQTPGERTSALAQDLDAALSDFDEMLLREQERVKAATPPATATASSAGGGMQGAVASRGAAGETAADAAGIAETDAGVDGGEFASAAGTGGGQAPPGRAGSHGGGQRKAAQRVPPDIPDGGDDDVVARQLREAAMAEPDPQLRARLWDEYRRYKRGTR